MSQHEVEKSGIIYIIPDDELFRKYVDNEAFIDSYGQLIDSKTHRVIKKLKHFAHEKATDQSSENCDYKSTSGWSDLLLDIVRELWYDEEIRANLKKLYQLKIKPACHKAWKKITKHPKKKLRQISSKISTANSIITQTSVAYQKPSQQNKLTSDEVRIIKNNSIYHWFCILANFEVLRNSDEFDEDEQKLMISQLTDLSAIKMVNRFLEENPQLLQTYMANLTSVFNRELVQNGNFIPISIDEVRAVVGLLPNEPENASVYGGLNNGKRTDDI